MISRNRRFPIVLGFLLLAWGNAQASSSVVDSRHNLSTSGPGEIRALSEDRVCIFCHTPHNATPLTPLWNRELNEGVNYITYDSSTFDLTLSQPSGPSRLCLGCHDGTVALGAVLSVPGGISMTSQLTGRSTLLGVDLSDDHPFSFSFGAAHAGNMELVVTPPSDLLFYTGDVIHCSTCHDAHDDMYGMFLRVDNRNSALCTRCHAVAGWASSIHATSSAVWNGSGNDPWPLNARLAQSNKRTTVAENGCENCHVAHNAGGPQRLMRHREEEKNCTLACHNGNFGEHNIASQLSKTSSHPVALTTIGASPSAHDPTENITYLTGHVECQDCHDPHGAEHRPAMAPDVSGAVANVSGIDSGGGIRATADYEYEICLKCHGDSNTDTAFVIRVLPETNTRRTFATTNPSYHPVMGVGKNMNVPSLPSATALDQTLNESSRIYCSDCHSSNGTHRVGGSGPNGPHGSIYAPILRERYETRTGTPEGYSVFALCYRCHDRDNILADFSFQKRGGSGKGGHSGHLASGGGTPCSVCHTAHGVVDNGLSGDHTNLINFDSTVVSPVAGQAYPLFTDRGNFSGTCTLICHGVTHNGTATYTYP